MITFARALRQNNELATQIRTLFTKDIAQSSTKPFLRFSNPFPVPIDHDAVLATLPETKVTTLPNGVRIVTETIPFAKTTSVGIWLNAGTRFEGDEASGSAKFLEHMLFKGTTSRSEQDLAADVEKMGGQVHTHTGREQSGLYMKVIGNHASKALETLSDILLHPRLDEAVLEQERSLILADYREVRKEISEMVFDHLHATAFQFSPLGRSIYGPLRNMQSIKKQHLVDYMSKQFKGPRMVVSAVGAVNHEELVKVATSSLGGVPDDEPGSTVRELVAKDPTKYTGSSVHDRWPTMPVCSYALAYKGVSWTDPDAVAVMVLRQMIGSWSKDSTPVGKHTTSAIGQQLAITGAADSMTGFNFNYHDGGLFGVYVDTDRLRCEASNGIVINTLTKQVYDVSDIEVQAAKNQVKAAILFERSDSIQHAESLARDLLVFNRIVPTPEWLARVDAVDVNLIRSVADRLMFDIDIVVAAVGDTQWMRDYNWWRRRTFWTRY